MSDNVLEFKQELSNSIKKNISTRSNLLRKKEAVNNRLNSYYVELGLLRSKYDYINNSHKAEQIDADIDACDYSTVCDCIMYLQKLTLQMSKAGISTTEIVDFMNSCGIIVPVLSLPSELLRSCIKDSSVIEIDEDELHCRFSNEYLTETMPYKYTRVIEYDFYIKYSNLYNPDFYSSLEEQVNALVGGSNNE